MMPVYASHAACRRWPWASGAVVILLALLAAASHASTTGIAVTTETNHGLNRLVIIGASYAGSWGTPPLPGFVVVNRGVGGDQTQGMRARFQRDVIAVKPRTVLIWGHINNITQTGFGDAARLGAAKEAAREDYIAMLRQARAAGVDVILATEIPLAEPTGLVNSAVAVINRLRSKPSYAQRVNLEVRELNTFLRQLAAREKLLLLDFERALAPDGGARKPEYAQEDRSHVTPAGYQALTAYAVAELRDGR